MKSQRFRYENNCFFEEEVLDFIRYYTIENESSTFKISISK